MIRRLILFGPHMTEGEAAAATLMAGKMVGRADQTIEYRAAPREGRVLMFQSDGISYFRDGKRRQSARLLDDPVGQALAVSNAAAVRGEPVFNVFTGAETPDHAYSGTDAVFTVGLPEGDAVAWYARVGSGIAPGIAASCLAEAHARRSSPVFITRQQEWMELHEGARHLFFKRKPDGWREGEALVLRHARTMLADVNGGLVTTGLSSR